jgi:pyrroline-5-carboxylate reductase
VEPDAAKRAYWKKELKIRATDTASDVLSDAAFILLAVKPQKMREVLEPLGPMVPKKALVVSIAAGVSTAQLEKLLPKGNPVVRVMPNTPSLLGVGMAGVAAGQRAKPAHVKTVLALFEGVGKAVAVPEGLMDLVTGISGSGPAYFFRMIEALCAAGVKGGLTEPQARLLAAQTALGAARMVLETGKAPAELRAQVTSPGGTTQAGLGEMERLGFASSVEAAVDAATRRGAELRQMNDRG